MKKQIISILLIGLLLIGVGLCGCAKEEESLKMVIIPAEEPAVEKARVKKMTDWIGGQIGITIEVVVATDYTTAIVALKTGDADIARLGPFSYVLATTQTECEAIARSVKAKSGLDTYKAIIITREHSGINDLEDLRGKTFAFVDVASTSGYLIPMVMLLEAGVIPEEDFTRIYFAGYHDAVWTAVNNGDVDAGCTNDYRLLPAIDDNQLGTENLKIIAYSDPIPLSPIVIRSDMNAELKAKIQDAFLAVPEELALEAWKSLGYVKAEDSDYDFLRDVAEILDLDLRGME